MQSIVFVSVLSALPSSDSNNSNTSTLPRCPLPCDVAVEYVLTCLLFRNSLLPTLRRSSNACLHRERFLVDDDLCRCGQQPRVIEFVVFQAQATARSTQTQSSPPGSTGITCHDSTLTQEEQSLFTSLLQYQSSARYEYEAVHLA